MNIHTYYRETFFHFRQLFYVVIVIIILNLNIIGQC